MEARLASLAMFVAALLSLGASYRTNNFIVTANSPQFAKEVGDAAETFRRDLSIHWLGEDLPRWREPCPIEVHAGPTIAAGGQTSFYFTNGVPHGWEMIIQGSRERLLDSVLPHEVTHTIFATHFGCPLPRWADEGACTTVEHPSEKRKHDALLVDFLTSDRGIAFNHMFAMTEYPRDILPLYSQGYSLARFLIEQGGPQKYVQYVGEGLNGSTWTAATQKHYGYENLSELQITWLDWVRRGSPALPKQSETILASHTTEESAEAQQEQPVEEQQVADADEPLTELVPLTDEAAIASVIPKKELPSRARPPRNAVASSWYARQRDLALAAQSEGRRPVRDGGEGISHSRPPGMQKAEQKILQSSAAAPIRR